MNSTRTPIPPRLGVTRTAVTAAVEALDRLGFGATAWLGANDPAPESAFVDPAISDSLLEAASIELHEEAIGLRIGETVPIGGLGLLDYALCVHPTWRAALEIVAGNFHLMSRRVTARLTTEGSTARLELTRVPGAEHSRHWIEFTFGLLLSRMRQTLGNADLDDIRLMHPRPRSLVTHCRVLGRDPVFGAPRDVMSFSAHYLDEPLRTAELSLAPILEAKIHALAPRTDDPFMSSVQPALRTLLRQGDASVERLAKSLRTSTRTLQRELRERGTSFSRLLDDLRREEALELLGSGNNTVFEVSHRLGYADPSAFFRAFRRWTGTAPAQFRKST